LEPTSKNIFQQCRPKADQLLRTAATSSYAQQHRLRHRRELARLSQAQIGDVADEKAIEAVALDILQHLDRPDELELAILVANAPAS
jgi:uncharacterized protein YjiS (DUF1127 family)